MSKEQRAILLKRMVTSAKDIKGYQLSPLTVFLHNELHLDIASVLRHLDVPIANVEHLQMTLHESSHRLAEKTVAIGNTVFGAPVRTSAFPFHRRQLS
jgi:hypothetical protein